MARMLCPAERLVATGWLVTPDHSARLGVDHAFYVSGNVALRLLGNSFHMTVVTTIVAVALASIQPV